MSNVTVSLAPTNDLEDDGDSARAIALAPTTPRHAPADSARELSPAAATPQQQNMPDTWEV